jgi:UDP-hydrolysing UDP-N-acetyl-D-glucosamine 2-epimerase
VKSPRHVIFVTGTRADLGLMLRTLQAIDAHPKLRLSVVATGMHLDPRSGPKLASLAAAGITPAAVVDWPRRDTPHGVAEETGYAAAALARVFKRLAADAILIVGDRVEAFAAAAAAQISRIPIAHVHGGDRAEGQVDDSLRHAITKLANLHLAATPDAARRILRLGERPRTIHTVGAPGVEAIAKQAAPKKDIARRFPNVAQSAVVLLHPTSPDAALERSRAADLLAALSNAGLDHPILLGPNNDPGAEGIWAAYEGLHPIKDLPRPTFLGLLRDARLLVGNSSAGIIEAASLGTPVLDIGPRQSGRTRGRNVTHSDYGRAPITRNVKKILARPRTQKWINPYEVAGTSRKIAALLASVTLAAPAPPKLIAY